MGGKKCSCAALRYAYLADCRAQTKSVTFNPIVEIKPSIGRALKYTSLYVTFDSRYLFTFGKLWPFIPCASFYVTVLDTETQKQVSIRCPWTRWRNSKTYRWEEVLMRNANEFLIPVNGYQLHLSPAKSPSFTLPAQTIQKWDPLKEGIKYVSRTHSRCGEDAAEYKEFSIYPIFRDYFYSDTAVLINHEAKEHEKLKRKSLLAHYGFTQNHVYLKYQDGSFGSKICCNVCCFSGELREIFSFNKQSFPIGEIWFENFKR